MPRAINFHKKFVHVPIPFRERTKLLHPLPPDLSGKVRAQLVPPISDVFVAYVDATFMKADLPHS